MPKAKNIPPLDLSDSRTASPQIGTLSARTDASRSPRSPPLSPAIGGPSSTLDMQIRAANGTTSPRMTAQVGGAASPGRTSPKQHSRDASKSFFSNLMASKSTQRLQTYPDNASTAESESKINGKSRGNSKDRTGHALRKQTSTPDLPRLMTANDQQEDTSSLVPPASADGTISKQKSRSKLGGILTRSRSGRPEDDRKVKQRPPTQLNLEVPPPSGQSNEHYAAPLKTAPMKNSFRDQLASDSNPIRNRSADRAGHDDNKSNVYPNTVGPTPSQQREGLLATFQHTGRGVGDRLGKAGRGLFNKMTRSGSTNERELVPDEHYVCTTINLPLVSQTRKTRIAKKLERSNDKTEYWMPALPWRCIDYLNMQCEQEGLYRVPGSGRDVKFWQRRFDTEYDLNLFEEPELYDVNTIASMFKAWLRDLPDELFPKAVQTRIAKECHGAQKTPQMLKDELSKLPPFNYYLLFAITCHLSLLHSYADQNKMDYRNLCICFQPCLKIDAFCFQFLVIDWKECWQQGCWTEKEYLSLELLHETEGSVREKEEVRSVDDRAVSSRSGSSTNLPLVSRDVPVRKTDIVNGQGRKSPAREQVQQMGFHAEPSLPEHQPVQLKPKQRSLSSSGRERTRTPSGHGHAQTAPAVPRLVTRTPEQEPVDRKDVQKLPELSNMSPIRM